MIKGLKPHSHVERAAIIDTLIPLWKQKFGQNLQAIAACASYARNQDQSFSDLELIVFLKTELAEDQDKYLQRIVDGMLIEALYVTEEKFLKEHAQLSDQWYLAGSEVLLPVFNEPFLKQTIAKFKKITHSRTRFVQEAARQFPDVQEAFAKVLNALEQKNNESLGLLLFDAVHSLLKTLSLINEKPFTTLSKVISEGRLFKIKPARFDDLLDFLVKGTYQNTDALKSSLLTVYESMERIFETADFPLYDESIDPNRPNKSYD
ncbi:hypothetical protein ACFL27_13815 [candidate division CSSED10-310 bacterium]|uniref:Kanamycin nucleotidyltransferase C-terminal domain-containing protein n=1 Tax=candidate division CSSED10-310 bacterium TaxID=2855610 RepID=A0ABV6YYJ6_UNCC1